MWNVGIGKPRCGNLEWRFVSRFMDSDSPDGVAFVWFLSWKVLKKPGALRAPECVEHNVI